MTIALPVYPDRRVLPGLAADVKWTQQFFNAPTAKSDSGAEIDTSLAQYPLDQFELQYNFLRDLGVFPPSTTITALTVLEFRTLAGFLRQIGGVSGRFLFKWDIDCQVFQQLLGTGDGATVTFPFVRTFGAGGFGTTEPVGAIDTSQPINVYLNDSATPISPSLYTLNTSSPVAQSVTFATPPAAGQHVRADFSYFYYCKFADDSATLEKFMHRLWLLQSVKIKSCRPGT